MPNTFDNNFTQAKEGLRESTRQLKKDLKQLNDWDFSQIARIETMIVDNQKAAKLIDRTEKRLQRVSNHIADLDKLLLKAAPLAMRDLVYSHAASEILRNKVLVQYLINMASGAGITADLIHANINNKSTPALIVRNDK